MPRPKRPEACENLADIREGIDELDRQIVDVLQRRLAYVKAAAQFKPTEESIAAPQRVAAMLSDRRAWAEAAGLPAGVAGPCVPAAGVSALAERPKIADMMSPKMLMTKRLLIFDGE